MERLVDGRHVRRRTSRSRNAEASAAERIAATKVVNNRVIIRHLMEVCPIKLLPKVLSVSKEWESLASQFWHSEATIKITPDNEEFAVHVVNGGLHKIITAQELDSLGSFRRFHLKGWKFGKSPFLSDGATQELAIEFLNRLNANVENLVISRCIFSTANQFRSLIYRPRPNLKHLELTKLTTDPTALYPRVSAIISQPVSDTAYAPGNGEQPQVTSLTVTMGLNSLLPVSWVELLAHFPNLEEVTISYLTDESLFDQQFGFPVGQNLLQFLDAIGIFRKADPAKLPLRRLKVEPTLRLLKSQEHYNVFSRIRRLGLQLPVFWVDMDCSLHQIRSNFAFHGMGIHNLHMNSLRSYNPNLPDQLRSFFSLGVEMQQLKELTLSDNEGLGGNLKFLRFVPNLKKLRMYSSTLENGRGAQFPDATSMMINTGNEMDGIQLLALIELYFGYIMNNGELRQLMQWFPNVRFLTINVDDEQFGMVCTGWPKLKHLHLYGKRLSEDGLTGTEKGFTGPQRPSIRMLRALPDYMSSLLFLPLPADLTCFRIQGIRAPLTDLTKESLLLLHKLHIIDIPKQTHQFDERAIAKLRRNIKHCWFRSTVGWPDSCSKRDFCGFIHVLEGRHVQISF